MINVDITSKRFASNADSPVLGPIAFEVNAGESLAITGPSGVGKSTLLRIAAGLDEDFEGTVTRSEKFSMVFQEPTLLPWRRVVKNLTLLHPAVALNDVHQMLERVGLHEKMNDWPQQLSLGQQRRLSLARAFLGNPDLLIMDEPFVSLDEATHQEMLRLTQQLLADSGAAVLLVTHDLQEASLLVDRISELTGSPATLQN